MKHNSMSIPDTFFNILIYICKRQKLKQTRTEKSNREKRKVTHLKRRQRKRRE